MPGKLPKQIHHPDCVSTVSSLCPSCAAEDDNDDDDDDDDVTMSFFINQESRLSVLLGE